MNLQSLRTQFPTDEACLDYIFRTRFPDLTGFSPIKGRKAYVNSKGKQIYPLKGTIFENTKVPLTLWFHALFLFYVSKNGISSAELARQLGVNPKTAWSMGHRIRAAMKEEGISLFGVVEVDESYVGGVHARKHGFSKKKPVLGMLERGGRIRMKVIPHRGTEVILPEVSRNIAKGSHLMTDEAQVYKKLPKIGYQWSYTKHGKGHYVCGEVHSNGLEGAWGHLKPMLQGTYRQVQYLQKYLDEFAWRYNRRKVDGWPELLARALRSS